ncbi:MAG: sigma-70 family RNA polymerase sigma factor [Bacteroidota bacterium]
MSREVIRLCKKEDPKAQQTLYESFSQRIFGLCFRYVKNEFEAEDLVISTFLKVFQHIKKFDYQSEKGLENWIRRIAVNESLMLLRKRNNFNLVPSDNAEDVNSDLSPVADLNSEDLYKLIASLPEGYRTVFNLYIIEGYSHKEIAVQLEISESTSKSQLSKAKAALRRMIDKNNLAYGT